MFILKCQIYWEFNFSFKLLSLNKPSLILFNVIILNLFDLINILIWFLIVKLYQVQVTVAKIFIYIHVMNVKNCWKYSRTENENGEPRNLKSSLKCTLHILWIYYDYDHSITLLRSLYLALGADSDSNGCHPYHGWQYFAGKCNFKFRSRPQYLFSLSRI